MKDIKQLVVEVGAGNPGAYTVMKELEWFSHWYEMLVYLRREGIVGGKLWELYKDTYHQSGHDLGHYLDDCLAKDKEFKHFREQENNKVPVRRFSKFKF